MSLLILASSVVSAADQYSVRLLLPASMSRQALMQELRAEFSTIDLAHGLCSGARPIRGLPSLGCVLTEGEAETQPQVPTSPVGLQQVADFALEIDAERVLVFKPNEWFLLDVDDLSFEPLSTLRLFRTPETQ